MLPVRKPSGAYRLVQDLRLVNASAVPISPVVPNPYTLLSLVPPDTTPCTKAIFFTIPLHEDACHLLAFSWEDPASGHLQQLTWTACTVRQQGFNDRPHLPGQALAEDLLKFYQESSTLFQYVAVLHSPSLEASHTSLAALLNILGSKVYRVSPVKAQLSSPQVTYLGILLQPEQKSLTGDETQTLKELQPPTDADSILSFLGVIGIFRHQTPNFAVLDRPSIRQPRRPQRVSDRTRGDRTGLYSPTGPTDFVPCCIPLRPLTTLPPLHRREMGRCVDLLAQPLDPTYRPVAYPPEPTDLTAAGRPACLRALVAAVFLTKKALKLTLQSPITVFSAHNLKDLLKTKTLPLLSPS